MNADVPSRLESHLDAFDAAWQQPGPPRPEDFLPPESDPDRRAVLVGLVRIDLERRLKGGEPIRVEGYLGRFPELRADGDVLLGLVLLEHRLRRGRDPAFDPAEYPARFPELASLLGSTFRTVIAAEAGNGTAAAGTGGGGLDLRDYVLLDRVGQGGMGEIYRGRDPALNRSLAVKVLRPELRGHAEAERRFEQEARINGVLQHPSIVPVHNLGRLPDGRLYFTMKLVRGRTLADILAEDRGGPGRLPEWLGIFEKVCQAVAYAHSRKVIHRDLKPANVMVGAFGEVQVMDWGLAKVLPRQARAPAGESTLGVVFGTKRPGSTDGDGQTGVVGTPAYMAPEQARGEGEEVDERADVFGLGGILCTILTGSPPHTGATANEALRRAAAGELAEAFARLDGCGADAELVGLCRDCLAPQREARPRDAGVVAARVAAYQAAVQERLRRAELDRAAATARAEEEARTRRVAEAKAAVERRARRLALGLAGAALATLAVLAVATALLAAKSKQLAAARSRADGRAQFARRALDEMLVDVASNDLDEVPYTEKVRRSLMEKALGFYKELIAAEADTPGLRLEAARARFRAAGIYADLGQHRDAEAACLQAIADLEALADLPETAADARRYVAFCRADLGEALWQQVRYPEARAAFRQALGELQALPAEAAATDDRWLSMAHHGGWNNRLARAMVWNNLGLTLEADGDLPGAEGAFAAAVALDRELVLSTPDDPLYLSDLAGSLVNQGRLFLITGRHDSAETAYRDALGQAEAAAARSRKRFDRRSIGPICHSLANLLSEADKPTEADNMFRRAIEVDEQLVAEVPGIPLYRRNLARDYVNRARLLQDMGKSEDAHQFTRRALDLLGKLLEECHDSAEDRKLVAAARDQEAGLLKAKGNLAGAARGYAEAVRVARGLVDENPRVPDHLEQLSVSLHNLGLVQEAVGSWPDAAGSYAESVKRDRKLTDDYPRVPAYRQQLATACHNLANLLKWSHRYGEAEPFYRDALTNYDRLVADHPRVRSYRQRQAAARADFAMLLDFMGQFDKAGDEYGRAIDQYKGLVKDYPQMMPYAKGLATTYNSLGNMLGKAGRWARAVEMFDQAILLQEELARRSPDEPDYRNQLASSHSNRARQLASLGRVDDAEDAYARSLALRRQLVKDSPAVPEYRLRLGRVLQVRGQVRARAGRPKEATADFHEALVLLTRLVEENPEVYDHGTELVETATHLATLITPGGGARDETERLLRRALGACEKLEKPSPDKETVPVLSAQARYALGQFLESGGDAAAAAAALRAALADQKKVVAKRPSADASGVLCDILRRMGRHAEAAAAAAQMARDSPDNALALANAACALSQCKALAVKDTQLPAAKRQELAKSYADRAMHLLRQAVQHGLTDGGSIDSEGDLDPLRSHPDFEKLLESLGVPKRELLAPPSEAP